MNDNKIIKVDFRSKQHTSEEDAFKAFEEAMIRYERQQRIKTFFLIIGFLLSILAAMAVPFLFQYLGLMSQ